MGHPFYAPSSFVHYFVAISEFKLELVSRNAQFGSKLVIFFVSCDLEIWWMTLKNNRAPLLCHFSLWASLVGHRWIETGVTVWKFSIQVKITEFLACVTSKFDEWPKKTIGHLFYATSSFVHYFIASLELKLAIQSGNAYFEIKLSIFGPCNLEIRQVISKNNRAPLLCPFKFEHYFITICKFKLKLQSRNAHFRSKS